jgi:hypothetical protein
MNMVNTIAKLIAFFTGVFLVIYFTAVYPANAWSIVLVALIINILAAPVSFFIIDALSNLRRIPLLIQTKIRYRNQHIRLSFAYLFRIKVKVKYMLVKSRKGNYYQLVGGAYKRYLSTEKLFDRYAIKSDRIFETSHGIAKNDLRMHVPGKFVLKIIDWFNSKEDREISQWREFCEELLTTGILSKETFRYIDYKYVDTLQTPMQKAKKLDCQEILIYEIFDFIPSEEQNKALEELHDRGDIDNIKWADELIINSLGFNEYTRETPFEIGAHTKWALNIKYSYE